MGQQRTVTSYFEYNIAEMHAMVCYQHITCIFHEICKIYLKLIVCTEELGQVDWSVLDWLKCGSLASVLRPPMVWPRKWLTYPISLLVDALGRSRTEIFWPTVKHSDIDFNDFCSFLTAAVSKINNICTYSRRKKWKFDLFSFQKLSFKDFSAN